MYERITDENPYEVPMRIYPAVHYTMGGLWVDYNLMSTIPGLYVVGEANFSDHGANRLGASALMQGLADGYFVLPYHDRRLPRDAASSSRSTPITPDVRRRPRPSVASATKRLLAIKGKRTVASFHRELGQAHVGVLRHGAQRGGAARRRSSRFPSCARSSGATSTFRAAARSSTSRSSTPGRVADFLELGELMCLDALHREESCGGHFREEHQTPDGEALRDDENFAYVAAWEYAGEGKPPVLQQGAARVRERDAVAAELQVSEPRRLHVWRQAGARATPGKMVVEYEATDVSPDMSFLEMLDVVNERLDRARARSRSRSTTTAAKGICGIVRLDDQRRRARPDARARRPASSTCAASRTATTIYIEPWRARAFPVIKDLVVDRGAFDRIIAAGGFISRADRRRAGRERDPDPEAGRRRRDGRRGVHRLRRVRRGVPERLGVAVHGGEDLAPGPAAAGPAGAVPPRARDGRADGRRGLRAAARCTASARRPARRRSASTPSRG